MLFYFVQQSNQNIKKVYYLIVKVSFNSHQNFIHSLEPLNRWQCQFTISATNLGLFRSAKHSLRTFHSLRMHLSLKLLCSRCLVAERAELSYNSIVVVCARFHCLPRKNNVNAFAKVAEEKCKNLTSIFLWVLFRVSVVLHNIYWQKHKSANLVFFMWINVHKINTAKKT